MYTLNAYDLHAVCYGISSYDSNAMRSDNPHSGIYEADTARTLDLNGGNPACNQGGGVTSQNSQGSNINENVSFTINAVDVHGVATVRPDL